MEAFSDGVLAIVITIMVLGLQTPQGADLQAIQRLLPSLLSYVLSFIYIGIYWNNHHHMLQAAQHVSGRVLWSNLALLFWLSLLPFATTWMGQNHSVSLPTALYGGVLLMAAVFYAVLQRSIIAADGAESLLGRAVGTDWKGKASPVFYLAGIGMSFQSTTLAQAIYTAVALLWLVPDRRIERQLQ